MVKILFLLFFFAFPLFTFSQVKNPDFKEFLDKKYHHDIPLISIDSLKKLKNKFVLDVREEEEFDVSHLKNARNVGYIWFDMRDVYDIPKNVPIIVYSTVGIRSEKIAEKLMKFGYKNVYNLFGGIFEWVNEVNPVYKTSGVQTTEVHIHEEKFAEWLNRGTKVY